MEFFFNTLAALLLTGWAGSWGKLCSGTALWSLTSRSLSLRSGHRRVPGEQHDGRGWHAAPRRGKWWILTSKSQCLSLSVCDWYCRVLPFLGILGSTSLSQHCRCSPLTPRVHLRPELYQSSWQCNIQLLLSLTSWLLHTYGNDWGENAGFGLPLAGKKYHGRQTWFAVWKPVDVGIVLMTRCLVLFPEMCLSLGLSW